MQKFWVLMLVSLLVAACGGGGGDSNDGPPEIGPPPTVDVTFLVEGISSLPAGAISFALDDVALATDDNGNYTATLQEDAYVISMEIDGVGTGRRDFTINASNGAAQEIEVPLLSVQSGFESAVAQIAAPAGGFLLSTQQDLQINLLDSAGENLTFNQLLGVYLSSRPNQRDLTTATYAFDSNTTDIDATAAFAVAGSQIRLADAAALETLIGAGGSYQIDIWVYNSTSEDLYRARTVVSLADRSSADPAYEVRLLAANRDPVPIAGADVGFQFTDLAQDFIQDSIAGTLGQRAVFNSIFRNTAVSDDFAAGLIAGALVDTDLQFGGELYFRSNSNIQNAPMVSAATALTDDALGAAAAARLGLAAGLTDGASMAAITSAENISVRTVDVVDTQNSVELIVDAEVPSALSALEAQRMGVVFGIFSAGGVLIDQQIIRLADMAEPDAGLSSDNGYLATRPHAVRFTLPGTTAARTLYIAAHMKRETSTPFIFNWGVVDTQSYAVFEDVTELADDTADVLDIPFVHEGSGASAVAPRALIFDLQAFTDDADIDESAVSELRIYGADNSLLLQLTGSAALNADDDVQFPLDFSFAADRNNAAERIFIEIDYADYTTRVSHVVYPLDGQAIPAQGRAGDREENGGDSFVAEGGIATLIDDMLALAAPPLLDDLTLANGVFSSRGGHEDGRQVDIDFFGEFLLLRTSALSYLRLEQLVVAAVNDTITPTEEEEVISWISAQRRAMMAFGNCGVFYGPRGRAVADVLPEGWLADLLNTLEFLDANGQTQRVLRFEENINVSGACARTDLDDPELDDLMIPLPNMLDHFHFDSGLRRPSNG